MTTLKEKMKKDAADASNIKKRISKPNNKNLDVYSVAATLYEEAKDLDNKGITRVAETIRNRYNYYEKNKTNGVTHISYRDIVAAPNQYLGFGKHQNKSLKDLQNYANGLSAEDKKKWERCMAIAQKVVAGNLKTDYAHGALGFNQASVAANKRAFKTTEVFKDDSRYIDKPEKCSPHVFIGNYYLSALKTPQGKVLAKGGNPNQNTNQNTLIAQRCVKRQNANG